MEFFLLTLFRKLAGRTLFITGASRGIGKAIALKAGKIVNKNINFINNFQFLFLVAGDGANIVVAAKTAEPHVCHTLISI